MKRTNSEVSTAHASSQNWVEPLEPRMLLAADLIAGIGELKLDNAIVVGDKAKGVAKLEIINAGDEAADPKAKVAVQVVLRPVEGGDDVVVGEKSTKLGNKNLDKAKKANVKIKVPQDLPMGDYDVIVLVDVEDVIAEDNEANNEGDFDRAFAAAAAFGDIFVDSIKTKIKPDVEAGDVLKSKLKIGNLGNSIAEGLANLRLFAVGGGNEFLLGELNDAKIKAKPGKFNKPLKLNIELPVSLDENINYQIEARIVDTTVPGDSAANNIFLYDTVLNVNPRELILAEFGDTIRFFDEESTNADGSISPINGAKIVSRAGKFIDGLGRTGQYFWTGFLKVPFIEKLGTITLVYDFQPDLIPQTLPLALQFKGKLPEGIGGKTLTALASGKGSQGTATNINVNQFNFSLK